MNPENITDVTKAIQLALAPVFLLTGIAGILNVMMGRLSRIIERGRSIADGHAFMETEDQKHRELHNLERRRHNVSIGITACTIAALMLCTVIATLFIEAMMAVPLHWLVGVLFTASTMALVVGLAFFLREVHIATNTVRIRIPGKKTMD